jgi:hypothetical protein
VSDPKTPNETDKDQVSDTDHVAETSDPETGPPHKTEIEDAEILDESRADGDTPDTADTAQDPTDTDTDWRDTEDTPTSEDQARDSDEPLTDRDADPDEIKDQDASTESSDHRDDPAPEPVPETAATTPPPEKKSGFMGPFLGGVVAAGVGFGACYYLVTSGILPSGQEMPTFDAERAQLTSLQEQTGALQPEIQALAGASAADPRVDTLTGTIEGLETSLTQLQSEIGTVQGEIAGQADLLANLESQMSNVAEQLEAIAALPEGTGTADTAALAALQTTLAQQQAENEAMQARLAELTSAAQAESAALQARLSEMASAAEAEMEAVREQAGALQSETQAAVDQAANRAFVAGLSAALENGSAFAPAMASVTMPVPEPLSAVAETGVETLLELQRQFPAAARAGLSASLKATVSDNPTDRVVAFLRTQVGARSLEPREGDDPDAVLSRAQGAVDSGQLEAALAEIATLPEAGQAAMASWTGAAQARVDALAALATLAADMNTN